VKRRRRMQDARPLVFGSVLPDSAFRIIALTAAALVSEHDLALAAGMNDFLTKPIDAPKLRRTLARHVRKESGTQAVDAG